MPAIDRFIPAPDVRDRHHIFIPAPAPLVFQIAEHADLQAIAPIRWLFRTRAFLLGTRYQPMPAAGLIEQMLKIGWGILDRSPGREVVIGSATEPWLARPRFHAIPPTDFLSFAEPGFVKIAWTLEAEPIEPALCRFQTETRVVATDEPARRKFKSYWRKFGIGIRIIRWLCLPALKRTAIQQYRAGH